MQTQIAVSLLDVVVGLVLNPAIIAIGANLANLRCR